MDRRVSFPSGGSAPRHAVELQCMLDTLDLATLLAFSENKLDHTHTVDAEGNATGRLAEDDKEDLLKLRDQWQQQQRLCLLNFAGQLTSKQQKLLHHVLFETDYPLHLRYNLNLLEQCKQQIRDALHKPKKEAKPTTEEPTAQDKKKKHHHRRDRS